LKTLDIVIKDSIKDKYQRQRPKPKEQSHQPSVTSKTAIKDSMKTKYQHSHQRTAIKECKDNIVTAIVITSKPRCHQPMLSTSTLLIRKEGR
jgi:hypothetical protein